VLKDQDFAHNDARVVSVDTLQALVLQGYHIVAHSLQSGFQRRRELLFVSTSVTTIPRARTASAVFRKMSALGRVL
jgi:hypothetical protein